MTREHLSRGRIFRCGLAAVVLMVFLLAAGCSRSAAVEPGKEEVKRSYTKGQLMTIAATERNRYQNIYTSQIWSVEDKTGGGNFEDRLTGQIRQFFMELGTMNLLADENGIELTSQEKDSIKRLSEQYYGLLSKADRDYIGADQEEVYELYCEYYRADKLVTELTQDQNLEISDAEAKVIEVLPISVRNRQTAEEVLAQAQAEGADFSAIAKKYSTDGGVGADGAESESERAGESGVCVGTGRDQWDCGGKWRLLHFKVHQRLRRGGDCGAQEKVGAGEEEQRLPKDLRPLRGQPCGGVRRENVVGNPL